MLQRDDLLRLARIINYDRYLTPSLEMLSVSGTEYEYVQAAIHKPLDTGGYSIIWQSWRKAVINDGLGPFFDTNEIKKRMQENEIRIRKEMKTLELRTMLETLPLQFKFDSGMKVVVLPKLLSGPHKVYIKWSTNRNLYVEQYSIDPRTDLYKKWFNSEKAKTDIGQDWRYLLQLNFPEIDPTNILYKYFEGVFTGSTSQNPGDIELQLVKGTELYSKEQFPDGPLTVSENEKILENRLKEKVAEYTSTPATKTPEKRIKITPTPKLHSNEEGQKMVCIKDPKNGNIIRVAKYYTGKFIKDGFTFVSKEEYKLQQRLKYEKRKEMSEGNLEAQLLKFKGPRQPRRGTKIKGQQNSPYIRKQTITSTVFDKKIETEVRKLNHKGKKVHNDVLIQTVAQEQVEIKQVIPQYEYKPVVWEVWGYREEMKPNSKGVLEYHRWKDKLLETIPFLNKKGEPLKRKHFIGNKVEYVTITRNIPTTRKTIKVLQIPSVKTQELKLAMQKDPTIPIGSILVKPKVISQRNKHILGEDKNGVPRWKEMYMEFKRTESPILKRGIRETPQLKEYLKIKVNLHKRGLQQ